MKRLFAAPAVIAFGLLAIAAPAAAQSNADMSVEDMERALGLGASKSTPAAARSEGPRFRAPTFSSGAAKSAAGPAAAAAPAADTGAGASAEGAFWLPIEFELGSTRIRSPYDNAIDRIAQLMRAHPELILMIRGHTDTTGSAASNLVLSRRRANEVRDGLIRRGIRADRLFSQGAGDTQPLVGLGGEDPKNRRVEFKRIDS